MLISSPGHLWASPNQANSSNLAVERPCGILKPCLKKRSVILLERPLPVLRLLFRPEAAIGGRCKMTGSMWLRHKYIDISSNAVGKVQPADLPM
jgi:hypothetical protein